MGYISKANSLEETILFLSNHSNQTVVERVILRLYAECHSNMDFQQIESRNCRNDIYQQSLSVDVSSLTAKLGNRRNKSTPQHKRYFSLKNMPALIKDININLKK